MVTDDNKVYLTREGVQRFRAEFADLQARRKEVVHEEENEEELAFVDHRLAELATVLQSYELIDTSGRKKADVVGLGTTVAVQTDGGRTSEFMIVGPLEANPQLGRISHVSPVGKALMGKRVGDVVLVHASSNVKYVVKTVGYGGSGKVRQA